MGEVFRSAFAEIRLRAAQGTSPCRGSKTPKWHFDIRHISVLIGILLSIACIPARRASAGLDAAPVASVRINPKLIPYDAAAFFAMLDLARPDLASVKAAVDAKDWPAAKHAWAAHLASRESPRWLLSRHDRAEITRTEDEKFGGLKRYVPAADSNLNRDFDFNRKGPLSNATIAIGAGSK